MPVEVSLDHPLRRPVGANTVVLLAAAWLVLTQNLAFARAVLGSLPPAMGLRESLFLAAIGLLLLALLAALLALFAWPRVLKPALVVVLLVAAICSYFMDSFRVVIDHSMILNMAETDVHEAADLLRTRFLLHVLLQGVLPAFLVAQANIVYGKPLAELGRRAALIAICLALIAACVGAQYKEFSLWGRAHREVRLYANPTYPLYSVWQYLRSRSAPAAKKAIEPIATDATRHAAPGARPLLVVLVIGETARAANFQLDGYARPTNPRLVAAGDVINYPDTWSCGTSTAESLPCMLSPLGRAAYSKGTATGEENILDLLKRVGVRVTWRDNNSGCKEMCIRVDTEYFPNGRDDDLCTGGECFDEVLLRRLAGYFPPAGGIGLLVLHQKGSHGPAYHERYPAEFRKFVPDCVDANVQQCSREEIANAYDNTLLYTDHVLGTLIALLRTHQEQVDSLMLYVSDHGESLGENGIYLHGLPYALAPDEQKHIPMVAWLSSHAPDALRLDRGCLERESKRRHSHDNLFHSLLGLFAVSTATYVPALDMYQACRHAP
ncbi:MAG TPA: phosphoethanolamine--lipid A transferase [Candidatus Binatia bacterium]|nr:phosphoethanolamine--lipid A transferase [Candidatus Binatia bacterium]